MSEVRSQETIPNFRNEIKSTQKSADFEKLKWLKKNKFVERALLHDKTKMSRDIARLKHSIAWSRCKNNVRKNFCFNILALLWPMLALFSGKKCPQCQMVTADPGVFPKSSKLNQGLAFLPIAQPTASRWMLINFEWSSWVPYLLLIQLLWGEQRGNFTYRLWMIRPILKGERGVKLIQLTWPESQGNKVIQGRGNQYWEGKINKCPLQKVVQQWEKFQRMEWTVSEKGIMKRRNNKKASLFTGVSQILLKIIISDIGLLQSGYCHYL